MPTKLSDKGNPNETVPASLAVIPQHCLHFYVFPAASFMKPHTCLALSVGCPPTYEVFDVEHKGSDFTLEGNSTGSRPVVNGPGPVFVTMGSYRPGPSEFAQLTDEQKQFVLCYGLLLAPIDEAISKNYAPQPFTIDQLIDNGSVWAEAAWRNFCVAVYNSEPPKSVTVKR